MSASVGGRLEEVEPKRSLFGPDYLRLAALVLVAVAVHAWLVSHTAVTARDSLGFARMALCFDTPSAAPPHADGRPKTTLDHLRSAEHPPGFPLAVWAVYKGLGTVSDAPAGITGLISSLCSPKARLAILISWLFIQFLLPRMVLISPLCARQRNGCASHHCGKVLVE